MCPAPANGSNTKPLSSQMYYIDNTVTYECIEGYTSDQPLVATCTISGTWSIDPPSCTRK